MLIDMSYNIFLNERLKNMNNVLRVSWGTEDRDFRDSGFVEVVVESGDVLKEVEGYLRREEEYDDEGIEIMKGMLESGRWFGGSWCREGDRRINWETDVSWKEFVIL